jgi:hypothetical protein
LQNTDKYSAVFTKYSVAEYAADHYSAEYSSDRIVGRSLVMSLIMFNPTGQQEASWLLGASGLFSMVSGHL